MIGKLKGVLTEVDGTTGLVETASGVSYLVYLTPALLALNPHSEVDLYTYLQVRDDALVLFGFEHKRQMELFKLLTTVPGVGPKSAYGIVSFTKADELRQAIQDNDIDFFTHIPGLGKKTAMKIILELAQKLKEDFTMDKVQMSDDDKVVIDALVSLGFKTQEARQIQTKIPKDLSIEEKIKAGLRIATSHKK
ncbi:MAG: Holliday junction ATP-dependent helicase RuvA [Candidatus Parcubacteria bacterium]|jgi:Holliday junction DNA helicase RuvA